MNPRLLKLAQDVSASYWFIPLCMMCVFVAIAFGSVWFDRTVLASNSGNVLWISSLGVDDARAILTLVAGSVIGIAGVSFSITIVAVSFATSNFGPRLISNFMTDRGNQITLGCFIGVFVFCLVVLTSLHSSTAVPDAANVKAFVPQTGIALSLFMAVLSMGVLIYFIHHVADSINIEDILARIGRDLEEKIVDLFPDAIVLDDEALPMRFSELVTQRRQTRLHAQQSGYVQTLNLQKMLDVAKEHDLLIDVHIRPGDYVSRQTVLLSAWIDTNSPDVKLDELSECFATGDQRTEHQNVLFLIEQLTEVIVRALSSGINDPYTAITCFNWLRNALVLYLQSMNKTEQTECAEYHRIQIAQVSLDEVLEVVFDACEQHVAGDEKVTLHTLAILVHCVCQTQDETIREQIILRFESLYARAKELLDGQAKTRIDQRYREGTAVISGSLSESDARKHYRWFAGSG